MKAIFRLLIILLSVAYPFIVYWGLSQQHQSIVMVLLCALLLSRIVLAKSRAERSMVVAMTVIVAVVLWFNKDVGLLFYPVIINLLFLMMFAGSLVVGMPVIERLARIREPNLPPEGVRYTRRVTYAWCLFFVLNAALSMLTVVWADPQIWLLYNGIIAYFLMGAMFIGEWLIRRRVRVATP
ncbi:hypothetical protein [Methylophaga sp. OBS3]|uniref:COG4648 family protein n=1 Tax=Methylophaga sp. OBS3 TaxID=2991934 RepID=UPI0022530326|nr:hypothetical protein [Methylophaga sp. OBS3]MCX4189066.1 hypothetical protein [Methylophaga sp. OBS3]